MDVIVVGGGDSALQESLSLLSHQVNLTIVQRLSAFTAQDSYVTRVIANRSVKTLFGTEVIEILGDERVSGVRVIDEASRTTRNIAASGVFVYVGRDPVTGWLAALNVLDESAHVFVDASMATSRSGLFAAGDIRSASPGHATSAMGDGVSAATSAFRYLNARID
jgi:thioredoxin reductase (NADPH)